MKGFQGLIILILTIVIGLVAFGNVVMPAIFGANQTGWDNGTKQLWNLLGLAAVAFLFLLMLGGGGKR